MKYFTGRCILSGGQLSADVVSLSLRDDGDYVLVESGEIISSSDVVINGEYATMQEAIEAADPIVLGCSMGVEQLIVNSSPSVVSPIHPRCLADTQDQKNYTLAVYAACFILSTGLIVSSIVSIIF